MSGFIEVIWVLVSFSSFSLLWFAVFIEVYEENLVSHRDGFDTRWPARPSEGLLGTHWSTKRSLMHTLRTSCRDYSHHSRRFPQEPLSWPSRLGLPLLEFHIHGITMWALLCVPLCIRYTRCYWSILLLVHIWIVSSLLLLWVKNIFFGEHMHSFLLERNCWNIR